MSRVVDELMAFYQTPLGRLAARLLCAEIEAFWPNVRGQKIMVLGYGVPLLPALKKAQAHAFAVMPPAQGVEAYPVQGPGLTCLADMEELPFADCSLDGVIALHAIENAERPGLVLQEIWRVLNGGGVLISLTPNRAGLWSRSDKTPFGGGKPYSLRQIKKTLAEQNFVFRRSNSTLFTPPVETRLTLGLADHIECAGKRFLGSWGGVLAVEAGKQLFALCGKGKKVKRSVGFGMPAVASPG